MVPGLPIGAKNAGLPPSMAMIAYFIPEGELVLLAVGTNARPVREVQENMLNTFAEL